ncbi:MAG: hypothetical protein WC967_15515, partial [Balneolaceae bacterium]
MFFLKGKFFPLMVLALSMAVMPAFAQAKTIDLGTVSDTVRIPGQLLNTSLSGDGNRCLYVDSSGNLSVKGFDCGSATGGDDMGSHSATQNIRLNSFWLSGDGGNEGVFVTAAGNVGVGVNSPGARLQVSAPTGSEGLRIVSASDWSPLNIRNSANTADIFRVDQSGVLQVGQIPFARVTGFSYSETDPNVYTWAKAATKPSYAFTEITGTVTDAQVPNNITIDNATNAANLTGALNWTQLQTYPTACSAGQFVTAVGDTLTCATPAGGLSGSGTANYLPRWTSASSLGNSLIYDNGSNVGISATSLGYKLTVNGTIGTPNTNNPYLVLDSSNSGGNNAEQSAQISLGEAGRGAAALHLAYTGDGYSYIGMGDLGVDNIPDYYGLRFYYGNNKVYMPGQLGIGADASSYKLYVNGASYFSNPIITAAPTAGTHAATKDYVDSVIIPWTRIGSFPAACSAGQYVSAVGSTLTCSTPANSDIYWTGTATNLNATTARTSLGLGSLATQSSVTDAQVPNNITIDYASSAGTATSLAANGANCSAGYYPLGVNASGAAESCTLVPSSSDIYWTGTATNLNAATGRASLGLGSLA